MNLKKGFNKALLLLILLSLILCICHKDSQAQTKDTSQIFLEANQAYENGEYEMAASLYQQVVSSGIVSGILYYNLGNCYTKLGEFGKALVNYRRAEHFIPRDGDLNFNLKYVLNQRKDKIETTDKANIIKVFLFWYYWLSYNELLYSFLLANLILWTLSLILIYKKNETLKWVKNITLFLFIILLASLIFKTYTHYAIQQGVVILEEATVRSGNGINHSPLFILHEGAEFKVKEYEDGWIKIYIDDDKIGWIASESVEII